MKDEDLIANLTTGILGWISAHLWGLCGYFCHISTCKVYIAGKSILSLVLGGKVEKKMLSSSSRLDVKRLEENVGHTIC